MFSQKKAQDPEPETPAPLHPSLRFLARAIAAFKRGGFDEDEAAWRNWVHITFDLDKCERAFEEIVALPERKSADADYEYAVSFVNKAYKQYRDEKPKDADTLDMIFGEFKLMEERKKLRDAAAREAKKE